MPRCPTWQALDFFINFIANDYLRKTVGDIITKLADADEVWIKERHCLKWRQLVHGVVRHVNQVPQ